jgi:hypothetical protein
MKDGSSLTHPSIRPCMALQPFVGTFTAFQFLDPYTVGKAATCIHMTAQTQIKRTQTSMTRVGFQPTIPVSKRAKTVHALDRGATVIGGIA